jgi:hypothetical protein
MRAAIAEMRTEDARRLLPPGFFQDQMEREAAEIPERTARNLQLDG